MDPITGALLAGAAQFAATETAKAVIKDAYEGLKTKVKQWFVERKRPDGEMALAMIEKEPEGWQTALATSLKNSGATGNKKLLQAAQALIQAIEESGTQGRLNLAKYQVDARGANVGVIGDHVSIANQTVGGK
ncbi:hypothetical protein [Candidatus Electronema sp. PJ]|uniref:hypothetical protein n=1 Tax=Candidatus Electronema sp. PJ TaxID=3401572 RepID=UPI003AA8604C